jgi:hypothetical protein
MAGIAQAVLKRVATVVVATSLGGAALLSIPEEVVESLLDPAELSEYEPADRIRLLSLVATDPRPGIRRTLAAAIAELPFELTEASERLVIELARDRDPGVRRVLSASLGALWSELPALDRSELLLTLAASDDPNARFVAASSLAWPFDAVGARTALEALAEDETLEVREAAQRAARVRRIELG